MSVDHATVNLTKREAVLRLLTDLRWHAHYELAAIGGVRYSARLLELRRLGFGIATEDAGEQGRQYRLTSIVPGRPQRKRVKVFFEEADVLTIVSSGIVPARAIKALSEAHESFETNREKL